MRLRFFCNECNFFHKFKELIKGIALIEPKGIKSLGLVYSAQKYLPALSLQIQYENFVTMGK